MKKLFLIVSCVLAVTFQIYFPSLGHAAGALYVIDDVTDSFVVGDFLVSGSSGPYQAILQLDLAFDFMDVPPPFSPLFDDYFMDVTHVNEDGDDEVYALINSTPYTLLSFQSSGSLTQATTLDSFPNNDSPNGDITVAELQNHLADDGVTSTFTLLFGLTLDQDSPYLDIQSLAIKIFDGEFNTTYSLHKDFVRIYQRLNPPPPPDPSPVPEPASLFLFGSGLLGFLVPRRPIRKR